MSRPGLIVLGGVFVLLLFGWVKWAGEPPDKRTDLGARLEAWVVNANTGDQADLSSILAISYDRVAVITPYADNETARRFVGTPWNAEGAPAYRSERWVELVFLDSHGVIAWFALDRNVVDLPVEHGPFVLGKTGTFVVAGDPVPGSPRRLLPRG